MRSFDPVQVENPSAIFGWRVPPWAGQGAVAALLAPAAAASPHRQSCETKYLLGQGRFKIPRTRFFHCSLWFLRSARGAFRPGGVSVLAKLWKLFTRFFSLGASGDDLGEAQCWQLAWSKRWKIKDKGITQGLKWNSGIPTSAGEPCSSLPASSVTWA